ncbi:MAG: hypothetical protein GF308_06870 [Candidatus Heimdallarchaeota archaeon]|nr:hypothetical protein [Candidatus Heimdallarchaeota archaeon]
MFEYLNNEKIEKILEELTHKSENVRSQAALSLGWCEQTRVVEPLIEVLNNDPSPQVRINAAMSLGELGNQQAFEALIKALTKDKAANVRAVIVYSLGLLGKDEAVKSIIEILLNDLDSETRRAAAEALLEIGNSSAIKPLLYSTIHDKDESVRFEAHKALEALCEIVDFPNQAEILEKEIQRKISKQVQSAETEFLTPSPDEERQKQFEEKRRRKIAEIIQGLPSLLEFAFDQEVISFREIGKEYDCDNRTIELALKELIERDTIQGYIDRENSSFIVKKDESFKLSPDAKEKLKLLRKKYGFDW